MFLKGVVENNQDPMKMGRLQIRILGIHTEKKSKSNIEGIPTSELPWANPAWPITSSANSGIGNWNIPICGTWVWCFSEDELYQRIVYFATLSGIPQATANTSLGFNDPNGEYPLESRIEEPDYNRLAANRKVEETIQAIKIQEVVKNIKISSLVIYGTDYDSFKKPSDLDQKYIEPQEPYATEYPYNHVIETIPGEYKSGHVIELDDTPNKERITIWHKAGTWESIHWDGQKVEKIANDKYELVMENRYEFINKDSFKTIWGDDRIIIKKNAQREVYGYDREYIKGHRVNYVSGDFALWVGTDLVDDPEDPDYNIIAKKIDGSDAKDSQTTTDETTSVGGSLNILVENNIHGKVKGNEHMTINGTAYIEVTGTRSYSKNMVGDPGDYMLEPHGNYTVKAGKMSQIWGTKLTFDKGCVNGFSVCPLLMSPHFHKSFSVKTSF
jgi:hypothetical protein